MRGLVGGVLALTALGACSPADDAPSPREAPVEVAWEAVGLPVPPGRPGRIAVRDAERCGDVWYAVGGVFVSETESRPAWWSSPDGRAWTSEPVAPEDYWARRSVISSLACRGDEVAALGAKSGGAHGNPRVSSWYRRDDGVLVDVKAGYTQYGGAEATNVARIEAGPGGWLISGNRVSGAAVWTSADPEAGFVRNDTDPALRRDETYRFLAIHQIAVGDGWVLVGSQGVEGRVPLLPRAWSSSDGLAWTREEVPGTDGFGDLERVVADGEGLLALGLRDEEFGVWRRDAAGAWTLGASFGALDVNRRGAPSVSGLVVAGDGAVATVSDGTRYGLWSTTDRATWQPVALPDAPPTAAADRLLSVATDGEVLLLISDDGSAGRLWTTSASQVVG